MEKELTYLVMLVGLMLVATFLISRDPRSFFTGIHPHDTADSAEEV